MGLMDKESRDLEMRERFCRRCSRLAKGLQCAVDSIYSKHSVWLKGVRLLRDAVECDSVTIRKAVAPRR